MSHLCIKPACPANCCGCNHAIREQDVRKYAIRYAYLRSRPLDAIHAGGIFIGQTPENLTLSEEDADAAIDTAMRTTAPATSEGARDDGNPDSDLTHYERWHGI
jgi:hypothetical protein